MQHMCLLHIPAAAVPLSKRSVPLSMHTDFLSKVASLLEAPVMIAAEQHRLFFPFAFLQTDLSVYRATCVTAAPVLLYLPFMRRASPTPLAITICSQVELLCPDPKEITY